MENKTYKVCIIGGGNAAHALAALLPYKGFETVMYCPFQNQAEVIKSGIDEQDGYMIANFASHNDPSGEIKGKPLVVSKEAADVIPDSDFLILPLPSFVYPSILNGIKDYLKEGQILCVTPGQGGFDWFAKDILGTDLLNKIVIMGLMPMPFNCRTETFGKLVSVQEMKKKYSIGVAPKSALPKCIDLVGEMFGSAEPAGNGSFLEVTMYPINAVIHPARLITLLANWKEGDKLELNPLFYEDMTTEAAEMMNEVNKELCIIADGLTENGIAVKIPHIFDWLAVYVYNEPKESNLQRFFSTNNAYKDFRCPLVSAAPAKGFIPDFNNRYFTEDINLGLCGYKGLADLANVKTPIIDSIIEWAQSHMGREFVIGGKLRGKDIGITNAPQRFGINTLNDLKSLVK